MAMARGQITTDSDKKPATKAHCVNILPNGSSIIDDHRVMLPDRSLQDYLVDKCDISTSVVVPTINGWIESTWKDETGGFTSISDVFGVPPAPTNSGSQVIFLFDSIQYFGSSSWIVQPVLTWGCAQYVFGLCSLGGSFWWIASWAVFSNGPSYVTPTFNVSPGDTINGLVVRQASDASCNGQQGYEIRAIDQSAGNTLEHLTFCNNNIGTEANPGVLEAYGVNSCNDLPATLSETFQSISSSPTETTWPGGVNVGSNVSPQCGYNVPPPTTSTYVILDWLGTSGGGGGGCSPTSASGPNPC